MYNSFSNSKENIKKAKENLQNDKNAKFKLNIEVFNKFDVMKKYLKLPQDFNVHLIVRGGSMARGVEELLIELS